MLESGKLEYIPGHSYDLFRAERCLKCLYKAIRNGVSIANGIVVSEVETSLSIFEGFYFEDSNQRRRGMNKEYFLSPDFIEGLDGLIRL